MASFHRPIVTDHGVHCTCNVFCGSGRDVVVWRAHLADRFVLDPATTFDPRPTTPAWHALNTSMKAQAAAVNAVFAKFKQALQPVAAQLNEISRRLP